MKPPLDKSLLRRDIQGLLGYAIAINESNEREQLEKLLTALEGVHKQITIHLS